MKISCRLAVIKEEMQALHNNQTCTLVPRPNNINVIGLKWIFCTKFKEDGLAQRQKPMLVVQGYSQIEEWDFKEAYILVIKPTTIRVILAIFWNIKLENKAIRCEKHILTRFP